MQWRSLPQAVGLSEAYGPSDEQIASGENILPDLRDGKPDPEHPYENGGVKNPDSALLKDLGLVPGAKPKPGGIGVPAWRDGGMFREPKVDNKSPYPVGETKSPGSDYTRTLVIPKLRDENTTWIQDDLSDILAPNGPLSTAIYAVDDKTAPLHPPKNKGHEVMVYLSYIIDHYDKLPDISIFMHAHRDAWHNNELLDNLSPLMIRHLSPERVTREGYMNLRCHWDPGCPAWLHPGNLERNYEKQEEQIIADSWAELFPLEPIPNVLSQPCCAQFAVSRDRLLALPRQRYVSMRDWMLRTDLSDYLSGRVFEYTWQYIFTSSPIHCPSMSACYCDGYGLCFGDAKKFDYWFELRYKWNECKAELDLWNEQAEILEQWRKSSKDGVIYEEALLEVPEAGRDVWLRDKIEQLKAQMDERREAAFELGRDPKQRALESGREWNEGDGY